jgi:hypothetical protein
MPDLTPRGDWGVLMLVGLLVVGFFWVVLRAPR